MTVENEVSEAEYGYQYDSSVVAPPEVIQLWIEVGNGLDKNQTGPYPKSRSYTVVNLRIDFYLLDRVCSSTRIPLGCTLFFLYFVYDSGSNIISPFGKKWFGRVQSSHWIMR